MLKSASCADAALQIQVQQTSDEVICHLLALFEEMQAQSWLVTNCKTFYPAVPASTCPASMLSWKWQRFRVACAVGADLVQQLEGLQAGTTGCQCLAWERMTYCRSDGAVVGQDDPGDLSTIHCLCAESGAQLSVPAGRPKLTQTKLQRRLSRCLLSLIVCKKLIDGL